jgi:hypothetical protein
MIFPDYVDEQLLDEVAQQLGINIEAIGFSLGAASRRSAASTESVEAGANVGLIHGGGGASETMAEEEELSASVSYARRPNFRAKIRAVLDGLDARNELSCDLNQLPDAAIPEATFVQAGYALKAEWDLFDIEPGDGSDDDIRPSVLRDLLATEEVAKDQIQEVLRSRFREVARDLDGRFALVSSRWHVHIEDSGPALGIQRFRTGPLVPQAYPELGHIPAPSHEIWVPARELNLTAHGTQRLAENTFVEASVFGRIDHFDSHREALVILPVAIYSEHEPANLAEEVHGSR